MASWRQFIHSVAHRACGHVTVRGPHGLKFGPCCASSSAASPLPAARPDAARTCCCSLCLPTSDTSSWPSSRRWPRCAKPTTSTRMTPSRITSPISTTARSKRAWRRSLRRRRKPPQRQRRRHQGKLECAGRGLPVRTVASCGICRRARAGARAFCLTFLPSE